MRLPYNKTCIYTVSYYIVLCKSPDWRLYMSDQNRQRTFATIVYPESAPENWREILSDSHIPALVSPIHSKDKFDTGEYKKEHYHVLIYLAGKKSLEWVKEFFSSFGGVGLEVVNSKSGYTRYLCHLDENDNPNKPRYNPSDVRSFGGANFEKWAELENDPFLYLGDILNFIEENNIFSFYELVKYAQKYNENWFKLLTTKCTIFFKEYLKSRKWEESRTYDIDNIIDGWENKKSNSKSGILDDANGRIEVVSE